MREKNNRLFVVLLLALSIASISAVNLYSLIYANWRECANAPGCTCTVTPDIKKSMSPSLKIYIVESAGYFVKSHDAYLEYLYCVEMSESKGVDSEGLKVALYNAIYNMEKAKTAYTNLKLASEKIPYNHEMIDHLIKFDYEGFQIKNGLNESIFEKVKSLLIIGDIPGLDDTVIANMDAILKQLYTARAIVDKYSTPDVAILWRINQAYAEAQLFGQYMSEVFRDILF